MATWLFPLTDGRSFSSICAKAFSLSSVYGTTSLTPDVVPIQSCFFSVKTLVTPRPVQAAATKQLPTTILAPALKMWVAPMLSVAAVMSLLRETDAAPAKKQGSGAASHSPDAERRGGYHRPRPLL
ncbi:hypothetical protein M758_UG282200 [Ceratodon purpureus]|nr:hypothetical protein M758_UG282200 [Ceratodon purpureus]